jgi:dienelactone hydrolase
MNGLPLAVALALALLDTVAAPGIAPEESAPRFQAHEVTFEGAGGLPLQGTLVMPLQVQEGGSPALLLLPGSGPTDRDGNQPPHLVTDLLKQTAARLGAEGIASLRFDKRCTPAYVPRILALDLAGQNEFLAYENFVGDARAAQAFLRGQPGIDAGRVGIFGHSEGGLIALQIGADSAGKEQRPAALVLAGTAGRNLAAIVRYQIGKAIEAYPEPTREQLLQELERALAGLAADGTVPADLNPGLGPLFPANASKLLLRELFLEPAELAARYDGPVLLLHGARDAQVPAEDNSQALGAAFAKRASGMHRVVLVPDASHNLKVLASDGDPGFAGPVAPLALDALVGWLKDVVRWP